MSPFIRKVRTASGATAVQIAVKEGRRDKVIEHLGSAHTEAELAVLVEAARARLHPGQLVLDLDEPALRAGAVVEAKRSALLWDVLCGAYEALGLGEATGGDEAFRQMVLARLVEPTSKEQVPQVISGLGVQPASRRTLFRSLARCASNEWRAGIQAACLSHVTGRGDLSLCLYDVTVRREALVVRVGVRDLHLAACRGGWLVAGGSLTGETPGRVGAALTKPWYASTTGWCARGERFAEVYARNRCHHLS